MSKKETTEQVQPVKRPRGRPKKIRTPEEIAAMNKPKLSLAEKQALKLKAQREKQAARKARGELEPKNKERFYCTNKEMQAELIKWRDSAEEPENRVISEELGKMFMAIGNRFLNHSNFRNYTKELKEDMLSYFYLKIIKGLKNYNFEFNNPFAFVTMAARNAFLTIIAKHYKHMNIKKELMKKMAADLEAYSGISPNTSLNKCIRQYLGDDIEVE